MSSLIQSLLSVEVFLFRYLNFILRVPKKLLLVRPRLLDALKLPVLISEVSFLN